MTGIIAFLQAAILIMIASLGLSVPGIQGPDGKPGLPAWDTLAFREAADASCYAAVPRCNIRFDEILSPVVDALEAEAKFSLPALLGLFPDPFYPFRPAARLLSAPIARAQAALNAWSASISSQERISDDLLRLLSVSLGMAREVYLFCEPLEDAPGVYEIICRLTYADGRHDQLRSRIYYDTDRGLIYGRDGGGMMSLGYDYDVDARVLYTQPEVWLRAFGFTEAYDRIGGNSGLMRFDTVRLKFPYGGRDWLLQLWKGRYVIACGGEVGLYCKPAGRAAEFYDCAEEADYLPMSLRVSVKQNGQTLVDRPAQPHWWMTGFHLSDRYYAPAELTLETSVTLEDGGMLAALLAALEGQADRVRYTRSGSTVKVVW